MTIVDESLSNNVPFGLNHREMGLKSGKLNVDVTNDSLRALLKGG